MAKLMFTGELPVFVAGDHRRSVGRATGYEERGTVVLEVHFSKEAGLQLIDALRTRVPLGLDLVFSPTRGEGSVGKEEIQDGSPGAGSAELAPG